MPKLSYLPNNEHEHHTGLRGLRIHKRQLWVCLRIPHARLWVCLRIHKHFDGSEVPIHLRGIFREVLRNAMGATASEAEQTTYEDFTILSPTIISEIQTFVNFKTNIEFHPSDKMCKSLRRRGPPLQLPEPSLGGGRCEFEREREREGEREREREGQRD